MPMSFFSKKTNMTTITDVSIDPTTVKQTACDAVLANAKLIGGMKYAEIPVGLLTVHPVIQRNVRGHEAKIAKQWDKRRAGAITVSYRDGSFYIIDGQHRYLAARIVGESALTCRIYEGLTLQEEAEIFGRQSENVKTLNPKDLFKAMYIAGDKDAVAIQEICNEFGISTSYKQKTDSKCLWSIDTVQKVYRQFGADGLRWMFRIIDEIGWSNDNHSYGKTMLAVLKNLYTRYHNNLAECEAKIVPLLSHITYKMLAAKATVTYIDRKTAPAITMLLSAYIDKPEDEPDGIVA